MTSYKRCAATSLLCRVSSSPGSGSMETDDPARKVFLGRPQRQRRRGRPIPREQYGVEVSAIKAGITDWLKKA